MKRRFLKKIFKEEVMELLIHNCKLSIDVDITLTEIEEVIEEAIDYYILVSEKPDTYYNTSLIISDDNELSIRILVTINDIDYCSKIYHMYNLFELEQWLYNIFQY